MPEYTYRREDGTTFTVRQKFTDAPLTVDPSSGQPVKRVIQKAGIIFKGSGFYVNDSKSASKRSLNGSSSDTNGASAANGSTAKPEAAPAEAKPAASGSAAAPAAD